MSQTGTFVSKFPDPPTKTGIFGAFSRTQKINPICTPLASGRLDISERRATQS